MFSIETVIIHIKNLFAILNLFENSRAIFLSFFDVLMNVIQWCMNAVEKQ